MQSSGGIHHLWYSKQHCMHTYMEKGLPRNSECINKTIELIKHSTEPKNKEPASGHTFCRLPWQLQ
jgi:hypothetical protein